jgi:methionyl-tRNA formyltransferase
VPPRGVLNIHGAILPHYRGVLPSFWMLANGEKQAGVSIYFVNEKIDAGDRCGLRVFDILPEDTLDSFLTRSKRIAAELLIEVLDRVESGSAPREPLNLADGSYFSWPDPEAVQRFRALGRSIW